MPVRRVLFATTLFLMTCGCLTWCGCRLRVLKHNQKAAATSAEKFAQLAFVAKDFATAHSLLAPQTRHSVPLNVLSDMIAKMHPNGYPSEVSAVEFEPMPGQAAMNIFLKGQNDTEEFYYRMTLTGEKDTGYQVSYLGRGSGPYPPSNRRPL